MPSYEYVKLNAKKKQKNCITEELRPPHLVLKEQSNWSGLLGQPGLGVNDKVAEGLLMDAQGHQGIIRLML